jgi:hypothetical protein
MKNGSLCLNILDKRNLRQRNKERGFFFGIPDAFVNLQVVNVRNNRMHIFLLIISS